MKNFLAGILCGIIITTVGFSGVADMIDNGIIHIQGWAKTAADKAEPKIAPKEEIITEPKESNDTDYSQKQKGTQ